MIEQIAARRYPTVKLIKGQLSTQVSTRIIYHNIYLDHVNMGAAGGLNCGSPVLRKKGDEVITLESLTTAALVRLLSSLLSDMNMYYDTLY